MTGKKKLELETELGLFFAELSLEKGETMTKQNVLVSDPKSAFNMAIMPISNSSVLTRAAQKPPAAPAGYISISRKTLLKNHEINGEARINSWVDSMRASSPTHIKATPSLADHDQSSWMVSI